MSALAVAYLGVVDVGERPGLTARELQVVRLIACGCSNREIAARLVIARHTVHSHVSSILLKLEAANRAEAVATALRRGLIG